MTEHQPAVTLHGIHPVGQQKRLQRRPRRARVRQKIPPDQPRQRRDVHVPHPRARADLPHDRG